MSVKTLSWVLLAAITLGAVLLFNYWASFQLLSTLVYAGLVAALLGLANLAVPFRFMGIRKRLVGALVLVGGAALSVAALSWPAGTIWVAQHRTRLDDIMPEYQFAETHSARVHAPRAQIMLAIRQSTFGDMKALDTLLKLRAAAFRIHDDHGLLGEMRIIDAFTASGYVSGGNDHEVLLAGGANVRAKAPIRVHTLEEFAGYREPGAVKIAFDFNVEESGEGWSTVTTVTRVMALDETGRGAARYWRIIVPGSGLLRRQWLDGIRKRAEGEHQAVSRLYDVYSSGAS